MLIYIKTKKQRKFFSEFRFLRERRSNSKTPTSKKDKRRNSRRFSKESGDSAYAKSDDFNETSSSLSATHSSRSSKTPTNSMSDRYRYNRYYAGGLGTSATGMGLYEPSSSSSTATGTGGRYQKSSTATVSALDRLRSNLSPVSSYYKPLMRTFSVSIWNKKFIFSLVILINLKKVHFLFVDLQIE